MPAPTTTTAPVTTVVPAADDHRAPPPTTPTTAAAAEPPTTTTDAARSRRIVRMRARRVALRATVLVTPLLLGALAVPSGGLFRGAKFRDLHLYRQYGDALLAGHVPYRDFFVEYPPGAIPLFAAPSLAPGGCLRRDLQGADDAVLRRRDLLRRLRAGARGRGAACASCGGGRCSSRSSPIALGPGLAEHLRRLAGRS